MSEHHYPSTPLNLTCPVVVRRPSGIRPSDGWCCVVAPRWEERSSRQRRRQVGDFPPVGCAAGEARTAHPEESMLPPGPPIRMNKRRKSKDPPPWAPRPAHRDLQTGAPNPRRRGTAMLGTTEQHIMRERADTRKEGYGGSLAVCTMLRGKAPQCKHT